MPESKQTENFDVAIVGAGILGLWLARFLSEKNLSVLLLEASDGYSNASYGLMGALSPHVPTGWNAKKQFQFDALSELPILIDQLEKETDIATGYARNGRIMPIRAQGFLTQSLKHAQTYKDNWLLRGESFASFEHIETGRFAHWIAPEKASLGLAYETLSARINPRQLIRALRESLQGKITQHYQCPINSFEDHTLLAEDGRMFKAEKIAITAGFESFSLLEPLIGQNKGTGVKGQALLVKTEPNFDDLPIIYDDGVYVIPHENGQIAIGSTSETSWNDPSETNSAIDAKLQSAISLCPQLENAKIIEKWAGVRPRSWAKDPLVGRLPGTNLYIATGGFKITLGIAHKMSICLSEMMQGLPASQALPESFTVPYHLEQLGG